MGPRSGPVIFAIAMLAVTVVAPASPRADERPLRANPVRPTFPDNARFVEPGYLQLEPGYLVQLFESPSSALHTLDLHAILGVTEMLEARVRWDVYNAWGDLSGLGDLTLGVKGGFFGGWDENTALAALGEVRLPTGDASFGLGEGVNLMAALVATQVLSSIQFDLQAGVSTHLFIDDPTIFIPIALAATWSPIDELQVMADIVETLDLTDLSDSTTAIGAGAGYFILPWLSVDAMARIGLSPALPDVGITAGVTVLTGPLW